MAKQNVFNFKTMQFELVECDDLLSLIDDLNAECAAQHSAQPTDGSLCKDCDHPVEIKQVAGCLDHPVSR